MIEIDECHRRLIGAMVAAAKPSNILELGFGTGSVTNELMRGTSSITVVDNWLDFGGKMPSRKNRTDYGWGQLVPEMFDGVRFVTSDEELFLAPWNTPDNTYDFLVSDADHNGDWCEQHFRVTKPGSWCFFHDTNQPHIYPGLARTVEYVKSRGWTHYHFTKSTLPGEECSRGLLMCLNEKDVKP